MNADFFRQFIAKQDGTTLQEHTHRVRTAGANLLARLPLTPEERNWWAPKLDNCCVLHDLGKIHLTFRNQFVTRLPFRHEIISLWFCENFLQLPLDERFAIATHHKSVIPHQDKKNTSALNTDQLKRDMQCHYRSNAEILTADVLKQWLELMELKMEIKTMEISLVISRDMRNTLHCLYQPNAVPELQMRRQMSMMRALLMAADHIGSARLEEQIPTYTPIRIQDFQPQRNGVYFPFRQFQQRLQNTFTDAIVHAPTASGKTVAALSWIYANQTTHARVFNLLPTTASCNAAALQWQQVFGKEKVTVLHSRTYSFYYEQLETENGADRAQAAWSASTLSAELFYPVKVATLHQLLMTAFKDKGWEFALIDYRNALFVIDEFHTYDALTMGLMIAAVKLFRRVFNARFLFMSATIPAFMMNFMVKELFDGNEDCIVRPDPAFESDRQILNRKRHQLYCRPGTTILSDIPLIRQYLRSHTVLLIVNTVKAAQDLYEIFSDVATVQMLHGGLHEADRIDSEKKIGHPDPAQRPRLLIATQAVEVSLQLDYDILFTENAPAEDLIQRLGRANREGGKTIYPIDYMTKLKHCTVPVYLFEHSIRKTPFYNSDVLADTWKILYRLDTQELSEDDLVAVCNTVYSNGYNPIQQADFEQGLNSTVIRDFETKWVAGHHNDWIKLFIQNGHQKIEVLCGNLLELFNQKRREKRFVEANQLLVSVYFYEVKKQVMHDDTAVIIASDLEYVEGVGYRVRGE
ncbi:CRISPR-associated helicase Cas3' [Chitinophaga sp. HK235]|uniref:CRISPR-associated helicase Cas3' n=1 Tax=Chitinophaga sp. HK235 TaxID=2952571 RepID=UPI001BA72AED|nr:CRISPR-associated helicase Cas3' [Chitinophaga sp. HK235]